MKLLTCGARLDPDKSWVFTGDTWEWVWLVVLLVLMGLLTLWTWNTASKAVSLGLVDNSLGVPVIANCLNPLPCHCLIYMVREKVFGWQQKWARTLRQLFRCSSHPVMFKRTSLNLDPVFKTRQHGTVAKEKDVTSVWHSSIIQNFLCEVSLWSSAEKNFIARTVSNFTQLKQETSVTSATIYGDEQLQRHSQLQGPGKNQSEFWQMCGMQTCTVKSG